MSVETITIEREEYEQLLEDSRMLNHLEMAGVCYWEGYKSALDELGYDGFDDDIDEDLKYHEEDIEDFFEVHKEELSDLEYSDDDDGGDEYLKRVLKGEE